MTTPEPGDRLVLMYGATDRPISTAFFAKRPVAQTTQDASEKDDDDKKKKHHARAMVISLITIFVILRSALIPNFKNKKKEEIIFSKKRKQTVGCVCADHTQTNHARWVEIDLRVMFYYQYYIVHLKSERDKIVGHYKTIFERRNYQVQA